MMWDLKPRPYSHLAQSHLCVLTSLFTVARHLELPWQHNAARCSTSSTVEHNCAGDIRLSRNQWFEFCSRSGIACSVSLNSSSCPHLRSPKMASSVSPLPVRSAPRLLRQAHAKMVPTGCTSRSAANGYRFGKLASARTGCASESVIPMVRACRLFCKERRPCSSTGSESLAKKTL